ncbi:MAG TPA: sigma-70 family RNA polymerase sigma factor [Syntrophomonadaceae bacterium]|nr:sigma-70 family RNA polymerase sigma factor [Syntrophomonadaceae bacterium]
MLAIQTLDGELLAFEELVNRYKGSVFSIVYRMVGQYQETEDISQEVFITVFQKLYQFDTKKRFGPWIHKIAANTAISYLRKNRKVVTLSFDETYIKANNEYPLLQVVDPEFTIKHQELKEDIQNAIKNLSDNYKMVIVLRYQLELTNQEIAETLEITKENVEVRIHRARKALRKELLKYWEERGIKGELSTGK